MYALETLDTNCATERQDMSDVWNYLRWKGIPRYSMIFMIFPYIFCNSKVSKLQKMYGKNWSFQKTGRGLLCTPDLRWLNTVLRAVSGNSRDGECFNLDKQTWRRKRNGKQKTISQNLLIKILWYLEEFLLLSYFR